MISLQAEIEAAEHAHERALERIEELYAIGIYDDAAYERAQREAWETHQAHIQFAHLWSDHASA